MVVVASSPSSIRFSLCARHCRCAVLFLACGLDFAALSPAVLHHTVVLSHPRPFSIWREQGGKRKLDTTTLHSEAFHGESRLVASMPLYKHPACAATRLARHLVKEEQARHEAIAAAPPAEHAACVHHRERKNQRHFCMRRVKAGTGLEIRPAKKGRLGKGEKAAYAPILGSPGRTTSVPEPRIIAGGGPPPNP